MFKTNIKINIAMLLVVLGLALWLPQPTYAACGDQHLQSIAGAFSVNNGTCTLNEFIVQIIKWILSVIGLVAVLMIVWAGFKYMTSAGDEKAAGSAKNTIKNAVIGLALALLAYMIVAIVTNVIVDSGGTGAPTGSSNTGGTNTGGQQDNSVAAARSRATQRIRDGVLISVGSTPQTRSVLSVTFRGRVEDLRYFCPQATGTLGVESRINITYDQDIAPPIYRNYSSPTMPGTDQEYNLTVSGDVGQDIFPETPAGTGETPETDLSEINFEIIPTFTFAATDDMGSCEYQPGTITKTGRDIRGF